MIKKMIYVAKATQESQARCVFEIIPKVTDEITIKNADLSIIFAPFYPAKLVSPFLGVVRIVALAGSLSVAHTP